MNLKTRMGIGVLALSVGFLAAAQPAEATNRGTQNGDESKECSALWRAETVLDADLTNDDAEYPDLMVDFAGDPVHYTNGGYIREVTPALKNSGMLEINHFYVGSGANLAQVWRIPTATKDAIKDARVTVKLPPAVVTGGYKVTFDAVSVNSRISAWGDNYSGFEWAERAKATDNGDGTWIVDLGDLPAGAGTVYQFTVAVGSAVSINDRFVASASLTGTYEQGGNNGKCGAPSPNPTDSPTASADPTPAPTPSVSPTQSPSAQSSQLPRRAGLPRTGLA